MSRALVLDFGGVITKTLFETHPQSERALGLAPGTLRWRGPFAPEADAPWREMQEGRISERDYWRLRMRETGALVGESWTEFPEFIARVRGDDPAAAVRPEALEAIAAAKAAGCRLAILSNELDLFYGAGFRARLPFLDDFDLIVDATHTGILKPDPRAFGMAAAGLGLDPAACVFVDDQRRNLAGAAAVGMPHLHFDVTRPAAGYERALAMIAAETVG